MSFEEKSAWGSLLALTLVSGWYFPKAIAVVNVSPSSVPLISITVIWIIAMIVILAIYHGVLAMWGYDTDERDRLIDLKAERIASHVLGVSLLFVVGLVMFNLLQPDAADVPPLAMAVWVLLAMAFSEAVKYIAQIAYYRIEA